MADVTGPISSLPGAIHTVPKGMMCDDHPDRPATVRVQGETDSFGAELYDMCDECYREYREEVKNYDTSGVCDWCNRFSEKRVNRRDFEEGLSGRVYQVCFACVSAENKRLEEEDDSRFDGPDWEPEDEDRQNEWYDEEDDTRNIPGMGPQPIPIDSHEARLGLIADVIETDIDWEVTLACVTRRGQSSRMTYYVRGHTPEHAYRRAVAMLPTRFSVESERDCVVQVFVPRPAAELRSERDAQRASKLTLVRR